MTTLQELSNLRTQIASRVMLCTAPADWAINYCNDLLLESLLALYDATQDKTYLDFVLNVARKRGWTPATVVPYQSQPFCCVTYEIYARVKDPAYVAPFLAQTALYRQEVLRSFDGAICHYGPEKPNRVLIDQLQDYAVRMSRAGALNGDDSYFEEAAQQYELFRAALRDPVTGLWGHARGWWDDPRAVVTTPWLRGHGWLIRGMVNALHAIPPERPQHHRMRSILTEFAADLLRFQRPDGMWTQVVDEPDTYAETSGTAMLACMFLDAARAGYLPAEPYVSAAERARAALLDYVNADGVVLNGCISTGPQPTREDYRKRPCPDDDPHAVAALIFAFSC